MSDGTIVPGGLASVMVTELVQRELNYASGDLLASPRDAIGEWLGRLLEQQVVTYLLLTEEAHGAIACHAAIIRGEMVGSGRLQDLFTIVARGFNSVVVLSSSTTDVLSELTQLGFVVASKGRLGSGDSCDPLAAAGGESNLDLAATTGLDLPHRCLVILGHDCEPVYLIERHTSRGEG